VSVCPIIPLTEIKDMYPAVIMESVKALFADKTASSAARSRIYSCMNCETCRPHCLAGLDPGLALSLARGILREMGEPGPKGLSFLLPETKLNFMRAIEAVQIKPADRPWITNVERQKPNPSKTVLFASCTGIMQPDLVRTALALIRLIDPTAQALGGVDYCCGDTNLRVGNPDASMAHFLRLVKALNEFHPENVILLCPTCKDYFDRHAPGTAWSWRFITDFLAEHIDKLGSLAEIKATVTIHDACHLARGEVPDSDSPRKLLAAIPGIQITEMKNNGKESICCGAYAIVAVGKHGADFRKQRLQEASDTGAEIMAYYCPGCQSVFAPARPSLSIKMESILKLLGESVGISHEDKLQRYWAYGDPERVLQEAAECIEASELPQKELSGFLRKYFK
jgi:Fe-S oxidoreductase